MTEEVLINVGLGETRIAVMRGGRLIDYFVERPRRQSPMGSIYLGRVERVVSGMEAAFVDIGLDRSGFLAAWDARPPGLTNEGERRQAPPITSLVHEGQAVIVQATKEPTGDKGARLSTHVSIAGRYVVFVPGGRGAALSRRITEQSERDRLFAIAEPALADGGGLIVRTAAAGTAAADLLADIASLRTAWTEILARAETAQPPTCLHEELAPVERAIRDLVRTETKRLVVDHGDAVSIARGYAASRVAGLSIEHHRGDVFADHAVEEELEQALATRVALPSGGSITIEATEALTAIDVNSGRYVKGADPTATGLATNLEAAQEIARQIRLRNVGGIIVIDFIHVAAGDGPKVVEALKVATAGDRAPIRIGAMSEFGLVEMTRKRTRESLERIVTDECPWCEGRRRLPSVESVAYEALRRTERATHGPSARGRFVVVRVAPEVAEFLVEEEAELLRALERRIGCSVEVEPDGDFARDEVEIVHD
ncbi:MAG: Rne/Rng family ribonuclease [Alphaproteobacteria bacterium]|nr:Rne/Rng family ribonuclease [Alphaproteobacteria bacterium]